MKRSKTRSRASGSEAVLLAALIIFASLVANTCDACAQDALPELPDLSGQCAPEVTVRRASLTYEGEAGTWIHGAIIRCMLGRLEALPLYVDRVRLLEGRLTLSDERDALRQREVNLAVEAEERAVGALESAERLRRQAEEDRDAWHRNRILWVVVGGIIVAGIEALSLWAWSELTP